MLIDSINIFLTNNTTFNLIDFFYWNTSELVLLKETILFV